MLFGCKNNCSICVPELSHMWIAKYTFLTSTKITTINSWPCFQKGSSFYLNLLKDGIEHGGYSVIGSFFSLALSPGPRLCSNTLVGYFDAHALAMDFMSIGFRECLTEVARYLSSVEGLDSSDPLRVRLVSHLSTCASQREAAAMTSSLAHHHHPLHPHHWAAAFHHLPAALLQPNGLHASESTPCRLSTTSEVPPAHGSALLTATFAHADSALRMPSTGSVAPCVPPLSTSLLSLSATVHAAAAAATAAAHSFPLSFAGAFPMLPPNAAAAVAAATAISPPLSVSATPSPQQTSSGTNSKPYRPWGTEVGAF